MKTARFLTAAAFAAIAFTFFACSSDDPDDNPGGGGGLVNPSALSNKQVSLINVIEGNVGEDDSIEIIEPSNDNGTVSLRIYFNYGQESESIPVGKIQDGKLSLDSLPNISKYSESFAKFSGRCDSEWAEEDYSSCTGTLSYPQNLISWGDMSFRADISGKECYLGIFMVSSGKWSYGAELTYFSESGKITGTENYTYRSGETYSQKWDASFSAGLNFLYYLRGDNGQRTSTTTLPAGTTLEWGLRCY